MLGADVGELSSWSHRTVTVGETVPGRTPPQGTAQSASRSTRPAFLGKRLVSLPRGAPRELWGSGGGGGTHQPQWSPPGSYRRGGAPTSGALTLAAATRQHVSTPGSGARHGPSGSTGPEPAEKVLNQLPPPAHSRRQHTPELIFLESSQRWGPWGLKAGAQGEVEEPPWECSAGGAGSPASCSQARLTADPGPRTAPPLRY